MRSVLRLICAIFGVIAFFVIIAGFIRAHETIGIVLIVGGIAIIAAMIWLSARLESYFEQRRKQAVSSRKGEVLRLVDSGGEWLVEGSSYVVLSTAMVLATLSAWWLVIRVDAAVPIVLLGVILLPMSVALSLLAISRSGQPMLRVASSHINLAGYGPVSWERIQDLRVQDHSTRAGVQWSLVLEVAKLEDLYPQMHWANRLLRKLRFGKAKGVIHFPLRGSREDPAAIKAIVDKYWRQSGGEKRRMQAVMPKEMALIDKLESLSKRMDSSGSVNALLPEMMEVEAELKRRTEEMRRKNRSLGVASRFPIQMDDLIEARLPPEQLKAAITTRLQAKTRYEYRFWMALAFLAVATTGLLISAPFDSVATAVPPLYAVLTFPATLVPFTSVLATSASVPSAIGLALGVAIWAIPLQVWLIRRNASMLLSWNSVGERWTARVICAVLLLLAGAFAYFVTFAITDIADFLSGGTTAQLRSVMCVAASISTLAISTLVVVNYSLWENSEQNRHDVCPTSLR